MRRYRFDSTPPYRENQEHGCRMTERTPIRPRDRDTIVQALAAGVVPRVGLQHIQVGRMLEVGALIKDIV
ncbi:BREX system ATP-binding domain-containing protein [Sphingobium xenophagum]|uniref:BREX system ATP-binding domain-containing protein n=1 Tax=Sphingobium xenophagum TaxID=121428 RepID=UPI00277D0EDD|nr:BREX system ATP-binding domain-containing protein [Sphingobium xenophagum]